MAKQRPDFVDAFGWCTWDAFYSKVSAKGLLLGLLFPTTAAHSNCSLSAARLAPGELIISQLSSCNVMPQQA
jgi:hypothetical protein